MQKAKIIFRPRLYLFKKNIDLDKIEDLKIKVILHCPIIQTHE